MLRRCEAVGGWDPASKKKKMGRRNGVSEKNSLRRTSPREKGKRSHQHVRLRRGTQKKARKASSRERKEAAHEEGKGNISTGDFKGNQRPEGKGNASAFSASRAHDSFDALAIKRKGQTHERRREETFGRSKHLAGTE